jgi:hypothetical protein
VSSGDSQGARKSQRSAHAPASFNSASNFSLPVVCICSLTSFGLSSERKFEKYECRKPGSPGCGSRQKIAQADVPRIPAYPASPQSTWAARYHDGQRQDGESPARASGC